MRSVPDRRGFGCGSSAGERRGQRILRISRELERVLTCVLRYELGDPRIGVFVVSGVELSSDLSCAKIFVLSPAENPAGREFDRLRALRRARWFIRRLLARRVRLRVIPELRFCRDDLSAERSWLRCSAGRSAGWIPAGADRQV